jgi:competence protein ComGC
MIDSELPNFDNDSPDLQLQIDELVNSLSSVSGDLECLTEKQAILSDTITNNEETLQSSFKNYADGITAKAKEEVEKAQQSYAFITLITMLAFLGIISTVLGFVVPAFFDQGARQFETRTEQVLEENKTLQEKVDAQSKELKELQNHMYELQDHLVSGKAREKVSGK